MNYRKIYGSLKVANVKWILLSLSALNLFFMHYYIYMTCHLDAEMDLAFYFDNILGVCFDVFIVFSISYWISCKKIKLALILCFFISWLWSFSNVMYSRFFLNYLTLSAVGQGDALVDDLIIQCVKENFHSIDLYYLVVSVIFFILLAKLREHSMALSVRKLAISIICLIALDLGMHIACCIVNPQLRYISYITHRIYSNHFVSHLNYSNPKLAHFLRGEIRTISSEVVESIRGEIDLSQDQMTEIEEAVSKARNSLSYCVKLPASTNIIFILVESYMSFTSDMKVCGKEITPFLNALKRDSTVYFNGNMKSNVAQGSSSDGQFIYMTGLLPLRTGITLSKARHSVMPGLPKVLKRTSRMIIPTVTSMWNHKTIVR